MLVSFLAVVSTLVAVGSFGLAVHQWRARHAAEERTEQLRRAGVRREERLLELEEERAERERRANAAPPELRIYDAEIEGEGDQGLMLRVKLSLVRASNTPLSRMVVIDVVDAAGVSYPSQGPPSYPGSGGGAVDIIFIPEHLVNDRPPRVGDGVYVRARTGDRTLTAWWPTTPPASHPAVAL